MDLFGHDEGWQAVNQLIYKDLRDAAVTVLVWRQVAFQVAYPLTSFVDHSFGLSHNWPTTRLTSERVKRAVARIMYEVTSR